MTMRTGVRRLLFVATVLVAAAAGVGGTLLYQRLTPPDTSAVDAQAAAIAQDLRQDLNVGFHSGGGTYGGQFTEGTLVAQVEAHGGALLSVRSAGLTHTAEVMLGLVPPSGTATVDADAYPVRCYRIAFARGAYSVQRTTIACPATRPDGQPGSVAAQLGGLLARQPDTASDYRTISAAGYDHTPKGAAQFLHGKGLVSPKDTVTDLVGTAAADGVYAAALRINGVCHYLRMSADGDLIPLWTAPAAEQRTCGAQQAVTASDLYGSDPAKEG